MRPRSFVVRLWCRITGNHWGRPHNTPAIGRFWQCDNCGEIEAEYPTVRWNEGL